MADLRNAFGKVSTESTLEYVKLLLSQLVSNLGKWYPNSSGQMPVTVASGVINTVTTVTTVSTVSNMGAIGGYNANYDQYMQMLNGASIIRNRIETS